MTSVRQGQRIYRTPYLPKLQGQVNAISYADTAREIAAEQGSAALLKRLLEYGANNGGLPNLTREMCRERLQGLAR